MRFNIVQSDDTTLINIVSSDIESNSVLTLWINHNQTPSRPDLNIKLATEHSEQLD